jgi:hypothetical protein
VINKFGNLTRQSPLIGRYYSDCHKEQPKNPNRFMLFFSSGMDKSGLNDLEYKHVKTLEHKLYTKIMVDYDDYSATTSASSSTESSLKSRISLDKARKKTSKTFLNDSTFFNVMFLCQCLICVCVVYFLIILKFNKTKKSTSKEEKQRKYQS